MEVYEFYFNFDREWKFMRCITYKNIHLVVFCLHTQNTFFSWITTVNEVDLREQLNTKKYGSHSSSNL